ncbi:MAG: hypothetical protein ACXV9P_07185 [Acidimicrobiia bacterium]
MPRVIDAEHVEPVLRAMVGAADVDGGPTPEQRAVIAALAAGYFELDRDFASLEPLSPEATADVVVDAAQRRRLRELLVLVEMCRHPASPGQMERVEQYCAAMGETGPGLVLARDLVEGSAAEAGADYMRFFGEGDHRAMLEPELADDYAGVLDAPDPELAGRLQALADSGPGTLGRAYVEFYERNGFDLPGIAPRMPAVFVSHDMCHVIGGYEPIAVDEIGLGAMQLGIADTDTHWLQLLGNLGVHEAGYLDGGGTLVPKQGTLSRPGAPETLAHAFWRGAQCTADFTTVDHLALAHEPLADVRAAFGVPARAC